MEKENQVSNLELSKKLKELEVKQESLFYWVEQEYISSKVYLKKHSSFHIEREEVAENYKIKYSAFTVAELGEMLPNNNEIGIFKERYIIDGSDMWSVFRKKLIKQKPITIEDEAGIEVARTLSDAMAKMLIYLLENKLIQT